MAYFDMPLEELRRYKPALPEPPDFDAFWKSTLEESRALRKTPRLERVDVGLKTVDSWDLSFSGFGGQPIKAWFQAPAGAKAGLPCVVEFIGYGGGRNMPWDWLFWPSAGYAHLVMDTRGQGSGWSEGHTADPDLDGAPHHDGFMTRGIGDPKHYYYRRVFADAVMAVETAQGLELVDKARLAVSGGSQGGGISLAAAGLAGGVKVAMPDVPFLCHFERAVQMTDAYPYRQIAEHLSVHRRPEEVEQAFRTLAYFDGVHMAKRAKAAALFSTGLRDGVCPPSTVFAAFNHYAGATKEIRVWAYNQHEGGGSRQAAERLAFARAHL